MIFIIVSPSIRLNTSSTTLKTRYIYHYSPYQRTNAKIMVAFYAKFCNIKGGTWQIWLNCFEIYKNEAFWGHHGIILLKLDIDGDHVRDIQTIFE